MTSQVSWPDVRTGASINALLFELSQFFMGLYRGQSSTGSAYGSAGSLVFLLAWVYYASLVFLFGAEFAAVYAQSRGSRATRKWPTASGVGGK